MHGYVFCSAMYGSALRMAKYDYVLLCVALHYVWLSTVSLYGAMSGYVWVCLAMHGYVSICLHSMSNA